MISAPLILRQLTRRAVIWQPSTGHVVDLPGRHLGAADADTYQESYQDWISATGRRYDLGRTRRLAFTVHEAAAQEMLLAMRASECPVKAVLLGARGAASVVYLEPSTLGLYAAAPRGSLTGLSIVLESHAYHAAAYVGRSLLAGVPYLCTEATYIEAGELAGSGSGGSGSGAGSPYEGDFFLDHAALAGYIGPRWRAPSPEATVDGQGVGAAGAMLYLDAPLGGATLRAEHAMLEAVGFGAALDPYGSPAIASAAADGALDIPAWAYGIRLVATGTGTPRLYVERVGEAMGPRPGGACTICMGGPVGPPVMPPWAEEPQRACPECGEMDVYIRLSGQEAPECGEMDVHPAPGLAPGAAAPECGLMDVHPALSSGDPMMYDLTVESQNPASAPEGRGVVVWLDEGDVRTRHVRAYAPGQTAVITAPGLSEEYTTFAYWRLDGVRVEACGRTLTVLMDSHHTATAVYEGEPITPDVEVEPPEPEQPWIYYVESSTNRLGRVRIDGTEHAADLTGASLGSNVRGVAVYKADPNPEPSGHVYTAVRSSNQVRKCALDGTGDAVLLSATEVSDVIVDQDAGHIYYCLYASGQVWRAALDGTGATLLVDVGSDAFALALDKTAGHIYCVTNQNQVRRAAIADGTGLTTVFNPGSNAISIALDKINNHLYIGRYSDNTIRRYNLDGSGATLIASLSNEPVKLAIAEPAGLLEERRLIVAAQGATGGVRSMRLDGSDSVLILSRTAVRGIAVFDPNP